MSEEFKEIVKRAREPGAFASQPTDEPPDGASPEVLDVDMTQDVTPIPDVPGDDVGSDKYGKYFEKFHAANPHVYAAFKDFAHMIRDEDGHKRYSQKTIMERLRWETEVRYGKRYKMGNEPKDRCSSRYARLLIAEDPSFATFFEIRRQSHSDWSD
jgi:hypothetical protein